MFKLEIITHYGRRQRTTLHHSILSSVKSFFDTKRNMDGLSTTNYFALATLKFMFSVG